MNKMLFALKRTNAPGELTLHVQKTAIKYSLVTVLFSIITLNLYSQNSKLSIEVNYGFNANFFVSSPDYGGPGGPSTTKFYKKNLIGSIAGIEAKYHFTRRSSIGLAFARSTNSREINYYGNVLDINIVHWNIKHLNNFFQSYYERSLPMANNSFKFHAGLFYLTSNQQEIDIEDFTNGGIVFEERNFKHYRLEEGGVFAGVQFCKKIDTKFDIGIKSRVYYLISTSAFEAVTLTPTLTYHF